MKYVIAFILFMVSFGAYAVPDAIREEVVAYPIVHQGSCNWQKVVVPCQIFYNEPDEVAYLVIYTLDTKDITHVVKVTNTTEEVLWKNPQYSI